MKNLKNTLLLLLASLFSVQICISQTAVGDISATKVRISGLANGQTFTSINDMGDKSILLTAGFQGVTGVTNSIQKSFSFFDFPTSNFMTKATNRLIVADRNMYSRFFLNIETGGTTQFSLKDNLNNNIFEATDGLSAGRTFAVNGSLLVGTGAGDPNASPYKFFLKNGNAKIEGNIITDANVGIGTTNFIDGTKTYRLSVKGKIRAEEIKVYTTWADFVFEKDYQLPTLNEVEKQIQEKGHLADIPSAKEVVANGVELGEMNKLLLQKIEELTLYLIEQNKRIEALEAKKSNK